MCLGLMANFSSATCRIVGIKCIQLVISKNFGMGEPRKVQALCSTDETNQACLPVGLKRLTCTLKEYICIYYYMYIYICIYVYLYIYICIYVYIFVSLDAFGLVLDCMCLVIKGEQDPILGHLCSIISPKVLLTHIGVDINRFISSFIGLHLRGKVRNKPRWSIFKWIVRRGLGCGMAGRLKHEGS